MLKNNLIHHQLYPNALAKYTLVFIHGAMCSQKHWLFQIAYFYSKGYQILTCDLPGHGLSVEISNHNYTIEDFSSDITQLINHLKFLTPVILIGHSMGARIAIEAYQNNQLNRHLNIASLVLIDSGYDPQLNQLIKNKDFNIAQRIIIADDYAKWCDNVFERMVIPDTKPNIRELILLDIKHMNPEISKKIFTNFSLYDCHRVPNIVPTIKIPILALQSSLKLDGKRLSITNANARLSAWLNLVKTAHTHQIRLYKNTGHFIMLERPAKVNQDIHNFINDFIL